jgi:hypothetical protein
MSQPPPNLSRKQRILVGIAFAAILLIGIVL